MSFKVDVLQLAQDYAGTVPDLPLMDHDYDDVLLALDPTELLVAMTMQEHDAGNNTFRVPHPAIRLLGVWYGEHELAMTTAQQLEATQWDWRTREGTPHAAVTETEGDRMFRLFPSPDAQSQEFSFVHGLPFGVDFPGYCVIAAYTEVRDEIPNWLDLPVALAVLARAFAREERYRDPTFASIVRKLSERILLLVS